MWRQYAELGLTALPFAEEHGGIGGGPVETMIVMEAFGRALALEPYFATVVLGGGFLRRGASEAVKARRAAQGRGRRGAACRSPISSGRRATTSPTSRPPRRRTAPATCSTARRASRCTATSPTSSSCRRASRATSATKNGIGLFLVDAKAPGVSRRGYPTMDGLRAAEVTLAERQGRRRRRDRRARQCLSADRAGGRCRASRRSPPKRSAR